MKRLALFFDGTWNKPGDQTNVYRLYQMTADRGEDGAPQTPHYDEGVGTRWYDRVTGGAFGAGLFKNVQDGYRWLVERFEPGDQIFLFGFSRGAFTARSLAGMMARCGLLRKGAPISVERVFKRYREGDKVKAIYELIREKDSGRAFDAEEQALLQYAHYRRDLITMVGVWDSVGSIGIPFGNFPGISSRGLRFHNTHLSTVVRHSYQALALDEHRKPYWAILWTVFEPDVPDRDVGAQRPDERVVEQRWFSGAHSNVGGGYDADSLPDRPLAWIQEKARSCGLGFRTQVSVDDRDLGVLPNDSYAEFLKGVWKVVTFGKRYVRWVMSKAVLKRAKRSGTSGRVWTVNERIDLSVFQRCRRNPGYRPRSLQEWAERKGLNLESVIADPEPHRALWEAVKKAGVESA